ncbi:MAG TPA: outer membrane protein assembly factor BamB [Gammaproteobacteria bacterium]|nr:outer membrane protein assembly factor BamB [Xanthomonadales bacterium]MCB1593644.1 outer membrane protein assembly factor BamB [Xanthomonadales bacterium]HOP22547.1 outer membrane protein assembly factor BamB [Gammaproteobacteria bacterium]HPI95393.1 outer membrane protein assembly factor BamB [Gammaproteobacteria bacterium]HPQ87177.1 outer membrane protein assembly factor BamB [Gammaproteobacteria bacterium]
MQRILSVLFLTLLFTISCSSNKKDKKFEPVELEKITQQGHFKTLWTKKLDSGDKAFGYELIPFVDGKDVFVADKKGNVLKLDLQNGSTIWSTDLEVELSAGPGVGSDILLLGTPEGQVIALNKETGAMIWKSLLSSEILSPPVIENNMAIVRAQDGKVYALNAENGNREWLFDTNIPNLTLRGNSKPIVRAGRVYIGFDNGKVAAIKQESGDVIWLQSVIDTQGKTELARIVDIDGNMALIATDLYLSSADGKTVAVATESGRVMWSQDVGSANGVTASRTDLFVLDDLSNVHALNRTDGSKKWKTTEYKYRMLTRPVFYLGDIIVGDVDGYIHVIDGTDGKTLARNRMGKDSFYSAPVISGSTVISYNKDGTLTAFEYSR